MKKEFKKATVDGNTAAAHVAYAFSDVAAIYPITPSSPMGEYADTWAANNRKNIFGERVDVVEMQSEAGAAGAIHGSLTAGALTTTFTASQGLLLMLPNMHKIAGEMLPTVFHVSARSLAAQSLSIFGDHSDVMSARNTGFALMAANSLQEIMDLAIVAHLSTLKSKVPFLNFFDGFRNSHEIQKIEMIDYDSMSELLDMKYVEEFRSRALNPDNPRVKVGAQNPDVYFQGRETVNNYYDATPGIVKEYMKAVSDLTGREYHLFNYYGDPQADKLIIAMGSGCETIQETINYLNKKGEKLGLLSVHLYRPFCIEDFVSAIPASVKKIVVLDRTKEPGAIGDPLYLDTVAALKNRHDLTIIGGRYGLSSKEFTPAMVKAVYDHLENDGFHGFTVGINDDVSHKSIPVGDTLPTSPEGTISSKFWGLGSDGTVGANKNSIKIIGEGTDMYCQGYFQYDSKKSGGVTRSHLRFGKSPIQSEYIVVHADFIACHNQAFIGRYDILEGIRENGVFLLNSIWDADEVFDNLTADMQRVIIDKHINVYNVNALKIAQELGLGTRINTVMQTAYFMISGILPEDIALKMIKTFIRKTFAKKGEKVINMNLEAVDRATKNIVKIEVPAECGCKAMDMHKLVPDDADKFTRNVIEKIMREQGDTIPVSDMPFDGYIPSATSRLEKRGVAPFVPQWIAENCIQCNQCAFVCPHAAIRAKLINPAELKDAPETFNTLDAMSKDAGMKFKIQVYPEDCQGCMVCVNECPKGALVMKPIQEERDRGETINAEFFDALTNDVLSNVMGEFTVKGSQFKQPLFEFSGACAGCGETPYVRVVTQLFGDRMLIGNATGCSSIYGGTFPTIPYCHNKDGHGPAWANSLFEDNAEYAMGMRLAVDANRKQLKTKINQLLELGCESELAEKLKWTLENWKKVEAEAKANTAAIKNLLPAALQAANSEAATIIKKIIELENFFIDKSVWAFGGDGWAYDIGYGGLDHVLASGRNINILVMDTEVYSNTGGQASKATPLGAVAKFAESGKTTVKKELGKMMMDYGYIYVASCAMGANKTQFVKALKEAEEYDGPSIVIVYSPCINHGINMSMSQKEEKKAVDAGYWLLYRFDPRREKIGENPFIFETPEPKIEVADFLSGEKRYSSLQTTFPENSDKFVEHFKSYVIKRYNKFKKMAEK
ncbi:MAG: pyruvate:ferredoxin (flavodoxin) oxidoreductase [Candidatus Cloacimonetes bacterium]|nr:pyruvate:ferredoxin (flavodoxin) oxidoreductase [Candidatus Cloacimonadota bacterium]